MPPHFLAPIVENPAGWGLVNTRSGCVLARELETAFDSVSRRRGLLGRLSLPPDFALCIAPCSAVHTFGMETAIDVVFVNREGRVIRWRDAVPPRRMTGAWGALAVFELAPGRLSEAGGVAKGDLLRLQRGA